MKKKQSIEAVILSLIVIKMMETEYLIAVNKMDLLRKSYIIQREKRIEHKLLRFTKWILQVFVY